MFLRLCPYVSIQYPGTFFDYLSFQTSDGVPVIKTQYGFWTEAVTLLALKKIEKNTNSSNYLDEHKKNYNHFDMGDDSYTQMGASTSVGGLGVGISAGDLEDANDNDHDAMGIHVSGDLGGAFWVVDYISEDDGAGTETDNWFLTIGTGF